MNQPSNMFDLYTVKKKKMMIHLTMDHSDHCHVMPKSKPPKVTIRATAYTHLLVKPSQGEAVPEPYLPGKQQGLRNPPILWFSEVPHPFEFQPTGWQRTLASQYDLDHTHLHCSSQFTYLPGSIKLRSSSFSLEFLIF